MLDKKERELLNKVITASQTTDVAQRKLGKVLGGLLVKYDELLLMYEALKTA